VGLTQKGQTNPTTHALNAWTDPTVGGFILIALVGIVLFIWAESRAKEAIVPLQLFRNRTYAASMVATFFAAFAFFGAIIFLPRWFQIVQGYSPTNSGLAALPLMVGLIFSSIASGLIVARTGRYKWLTVGAIILMGVSTLLMTQLRAETPVGIVWVWMFIAGLGVGPTFAVFTLIVQNAVPFNMLGVATSNLTFFRQIGGTVALAIVGTLFASSFQEQLAPQMTASGVPAAVVNGFTQAMHSGALDFNQLTGTGDLGQSIAAAQPALAPVVPQIVAGIHEAFSLGVASTFIIGVGAAILAALAAAAMQELKLRQSTPAQAAAAAANTDGRRPPLPAAD
jgi:Na+/melibiose symporter-like transporter